MEAELLPDRKLFLLFRSLGGGRRGGEGDDSVVSMEGSEEGLKMWTNHLGITSTRLYLPRSIFSKLSIQRNSESSSMFQSRFSLMQFLQALKVCKPVTGDYNKNAPSLAIIVSDVSDKITLRTADTEISKLIVKCSLSLLSPITQSTGNDITFDDNDLVLRLLTDADLFTSWLKSFTFNFIDEKNTSTSTSAASSFCINIDNHLPSLEFTLETLYGVDHVIITDFSTSISSSFTRPASFTYTPQLWMNVLKYCSMATKVSLRINGEGLVSLQLMLAIKSEIAYLEFIISPLAIV